MVAVATAIYEKGTLRLLTPINLPERTRVRVQIQEDRQIDDEMQRAIALLEASGLVSSPERPQAKQTISPARRAELTRIYAAAGALSDMIIAERDGR
jgi:predicted DNA-binding antitoxin AbrB/MazE fold protein